MTAPDVEDTCSRAILLYLRKNVQGTLLILRSHTENSLEWCNSHVILSRYGSQQRQVKLRHSHHAISLASSGFTTLSTTRSRYDQAEPRSHLLMEVQQESACVGHGITA